MRFHEFFLSPILDAEGRTYLFDLDFNSGSVGENVYTVDAANYGNVAHFVNHSCDPNIAVFNVWIDCLDPDLPRLCMFAVRDIIKGEQLTFDYRQGRQIGKQTAEYLTHFYVIQQDNNATV